MFQYCLFDVDGTLTDSREGITKCVQYTLRAYGIEEPDLKRLEIFIGPPLVNSFMELYGFSEEQAKAAHMKFQERFAPIGIYENKLYEGTAKMLQTLQEHGVRLAVASSKPQIFVHRVLQYFHIESYFEVIVGSEMDGRRGSKDEVMEEVLSQLKLQELSKEDRLSQCAMIGDRKYDILGAKRYGLTAVGVSFGFAAEGELQEAGADYIADSMPDLTEILLNNEGKQKHGNEF